MKRLYERFVLPRIVDLTCSRSSTMRQRSKVVPLATGRVLEIGFGSGLNLSFYDREKVEHLWALEPNEEMLALAEEKVRSAGIRMEVLKAAAEEIPLEAGSVDTVVVTYTLCTIPDPIPALQEARRVLRRGGRLLFSEHGEAPEESVRKWQSRLNPVWKRLGGGCNLNRHVPSVLEAGGFLIVELSAAYIPGWRPASFHYWGSAVSAERKR